MVSIAAIQAVDLGSIPGRRIDFFFIIFNQFSRMETRKYFKHIFFNINFKIDSLKKFLLHNISESVIQTQAIAAKCG